jgi:hypothetical protein
VTPLVDAFTEYRLAHLLRTGGSHRTPICVETQSRRFERQPAESQQAAYFTFSIADHVFIDDAVNLAGNGRLARAAPLWGEQPG